MFFINETATTGNTIKLKIWGRDLKLNLVFDYYKGESIDASQIEACADFIKKSESLLSKAKKQVEDYCIKNNPDKFDDGIDNIFKFVNPKTLYIKRTDGSAHKVAILCNYKFDPDNGLAIVFENEKLSNVGTENIIL